MDSERSCFPFRRRSRSRVPLAQRAARLGAAGSLLAHAGSSATRAAQRRDGQLQTTASSPLSRSPTHQRAALWREVGLTGSEFESPADGAEHKRIQPPSGKLLDRFPASAGAGTRSKGESSMSACTSSQTRIGRLQPACDRLIEATVRAGRRCWSKVRETAQTAESRAAPIAWTHAPGDTDTLRSGQAPLLLFDNARVRTCLIPAPLSLMRSPRRRSLERRDRRPHEFCNGNANSHADRHGHGCPSAPAIQHSAGAALTVALHR
jgi:hypothetical protein